MNTSVRPDDQTFHPTSFSLYNIFAAGASMVGLIGAVRRHPTLVSAYTIAHIITLFLITLTLLNIVLPFPVKPVVLIIPNVHLDTKKICGETDDELGCDAVWVHRCRVSFTIVKLVTCWVGLVLVCVQWWVVLDVWRWSRSLVEVEEHERRAELRLDIEKGESDDKQDEAREKRNELGLVLWSKIWGL
ncbi:hypothetical protein K469DRAFT_109866 [Zopfia rhizophila CBS 207.26]|uniref:Uncharacterized protein n=1 Tax=Zopfia rhizophila CBS 207.26 TaxID=1314779 RepID=A0A6A6E5N3_9PEZI|nr:hypothetical protein K469DRAFT_109866 [Zopfia rhizophila CBS 207.26]